MTTFRIFIPKFGLFCTLAIVCVCVCVCAWAWVLTIPLLAKPKPINPLGHGPLDRD